MEGAKHTKATHVATGHATTIPRHPRVNPHTVKGIVEDYLIATLGFERARVLGSLDCRSCPRIEAGCSMPQTASNDLCAEVERFAAIDVLFASDFVLR